MPENEDVSFIGPAGAVEGEITYPQRKIIVTITHENAGDERFKPMILRAFREYELGDYLNEEDFTASNGVRLRFSWPKDTQLPPGEEIAGDDYGALITKANGEKQMMFIEVKAGSGAPVFKRVTEKPDVHD